MAQRKPRRGPKSEGTPQKPRDRLAEIRADIRAIHLEIEAQRREGRVIRTAEDLKGWEQAIAALTDRLAALLVAEAMQAALEAR
jgi:hypothetical protein